MRQEHEPRVPPGAWDALLAGEHGDPFALLGPHQNDAGKWWVHALLPGAAQVEVVSHADRIVLAQMQRADERGLFKACLPTLSMRPDYRLHVSWQDGVNHDVIDDPYRYLPLLGQSDLWLLAEGTEQRPFDKLGAHCRCIDGKTYSPR